MALSDIPRANGGQMIEEEADLCPTHNIRRDRKDLPSRCRKCHEEALEAAEKRARDTGSRVMGVVAI